MNEFIIQIDKITKKHSMPRHSTAADKELPEDLPQELWAAERIWVRRSGHLPPHWPLYDGPYTGLQRSLHHFRLQMGDKEDNISTSCFKPCTTTAVPPQHDQPRRELPNNAALPKRVGFNIVPAPLPVAADSETIFPGKPARCLACTEESSSSRYPHGRRGAPAWQLDYTFFAASRDQEARGSSVGTP